jgi:hypothetical protein
MGSTIVLWDIWGIVEKLAGTTHITTVNMTAKIFLETAIKTQRVLNEQKIVK